MVNLIVGFESALSYWSNAQARMPQKYLKPDAAIEALKSVRGNMRTPAVKRISRSSWLGSFPEPLHLLVPSREDKRAAQTVHLHCWRCAPPAGAFVPVDTCEWAYGSAMYHIVMSSPEFTFLQMAQVMDDYELIELGYELCGVYAKDDNAELGLVTRQAVTTPRRLTTFVERAEGMPGIKRARRAAARVLANSRSPKESQISMLATLPRLKGGFGLAAPLLNFEIKLDTNVAHVAQVQKVVPDLYWPDINTVLEYDSRDRHDGYEAVEHDARKRTAYRLLGLDVITLTKSQFEDLPTVTALFEDLAARMRIQRAKPSEQQLQRRVELHAQLVFGSRDKRVGLDLGAHELPQVASVVHETEIPWE